MKIKSIRMKNFKRFTDLTIEGLPETARLVLMIGPNGSGKSSVFDALHRYKFLKGKLFNPPIDSYYIKFDASEKVFKEPEVEFHTSEPTTPEEWRKCVHVRSAYRNDLVNISSTAQFGPISQERRFTRLIENDRAVTSNYSRLVNQWMERSSASDQHEKKVGEIQDEIFGELRKAIERLFSNPELSLKSLGNPGKGEIFQFNKGSSLGFSYQNLSGGEKASLDLLLDITVVKAEFNDTVFCIDEPEAHMHTKLQGQLLEELYRLIPEKSQLWIATHSIGMVRKARDIYRKNPESVVFLDFGNDNFDKPVTLTPATPDPAFWSRTYKIALDDLAELVAPARIVLCEGEGFDAACYNQIFGSRYPDTRFISAGGRRDIERAETRLIPVIEAIAAGVEILRLQDRDDATDKEIARNAAKGLRTLSRRNIESYLLDDEMLTQLCKNENTPGAAKDLLDAKREAEKKNQSEGKPLDDLRAIVQTIYLAAKKTLKPSKMGNDTDSFKRDILAPLIQPGMQVYEELHEAIFGE